MRCCLQYHISYLPHLIGLCLVSVRLDVQDFLDAVLPIDEVIALDTHRKTKQPQQLLQIAESDVAVPPAAQNSKQQLFVLAHSMRIPPFIIVWCCSTGRIFLVRMTMPASRITSIYSFFKRPIKILTISSIYFFGI